MEHEFARLPKCPFKATKFIAKTNAIGIKSTSGRYGGTFAHKDIAFEFATWLSPEFKLYFIKEFQRLKIEENERLLKLNESAISQMRSLLVNSSVKKLGADLLSSIGL